MAKNYLFTILALILTIVIVIAIILRPMPTPEQIKAKEAATQLRLNEEHKRQIEDAEMRLKQQSALSAEEKAARINADAIGNAKDDLIGTYIITKILFN